MSAGLLRPHALCEINDAISERDEAEPDDSPTLGAAPAAHAPTAQNRDGTAQASAAINWTRVAVIVALIGATAVVGSLTYLLVAENESDDFTSVYEYTSREVTKGSNDAATTLRTTIQTFAALYPAVSLEANMSMPFVTLHDFEAFGMGARAITGTELLAYAPALRDEDARMFWEAYAQEHDAWIMNGEPGPSYIWHYDEDGSSAVRDAGPPPYAPLWQVSPNPKYASPINFNLLRDPLYAQLVAGTGMGQSVLSAPADMTRFFGILAPVQEQEPQSLLVQPVFSELMPGASLQGHILVVVPWKRFFSNVLHDGLNGMVVVVDSCGTKFTYEIDGPVAMLLGEGDLHEVKFDAFEVSTNLGGFTDETGGCRHTLYVYPSTELRQEYESQDAVIYLTSIVVIIVFVTMLFVAYDCMVRRRESAVVEKAQKSEAIVSSLFPGIIRDQLYRKDSNVGDVKDAGNSIVDGIVRPKESKPIAELFPEATVMFADIAGFTAWSSIREPSQVFVLLEAIFQAFDEVAATMRVFKVETVGDCYVCVVGVPDYCKDHAVVMAKFARECADRFTDVVRGLELTLGPDTSDLAMRFGMHSGPVTAGVLRGDRARFQLFGDTVNTAARIESTGLRGCIHMSEQTAYLLMAAGKSDWVIKRENAIEAKGKGLMNTYWLALKEDAGATDSQYTDEPTDLVNRDIVISEALNTEAISAGSVPSSKPRSPNGSFKQEPKHPIDAAIRDRKIQRLVDWNCELLLQLLKLIVARRKELNKRTTSQLALTAMASNIGHGMTVVEEVAEVIKMPEFEPLAKTIDPDEIVLDAAVVEQVHDYVSLIASMYRPNPFHNFEHASHVTMSVSKLLSRIVAPDIEDETLDNVKKEALKHDHTYGICDPLTQFAVVLSALIHDVDHRGVPNFILAKEDTRMASVYKDKSIAEQNSVDVAWKALLTPDFKDLRAAIFSDIAELRRFRQLIVGCVISTDIFDKELGTLRKKRWESAFSESGCTNDASLVIDRKATIVIEHLIQASDVAHTMQYYTVYERWNAKLFAEMYEAYLNGRWDKDPSVGWYQGELSFFDSYVIPLAKKLKDCGVFGVSSDEYLNYALENRREWSVRGQEQVEKLLAQYAGRQPKQIGKSWDNGIQGEPRATCKSVTNEV